MITEVVSSVSYGQLKDVTGHYRNIYSGTTKEGGKSYARASLKYDHPNFIKSLF
jgi:hypothetical protein